MICGYFVYYYEYCKQTFGLFEQRQMMYRFLLLLCILLFIQSDSFSQSKALERFREIHGEGKQYFVYQSVLRILNIDGNPDFNQLIRNVRRVVVHNPQLVVDSTNAHRQIIAQLIDDLHGESFENLIEAKNSGMRITLMSRGPTESAEFILLMRNPESTYFAEIEGSLDIEYIGALANAQFSELTNFLDRGNNRRRN